MTSMSFVYKSWQIASWILKVCKYDLFVFLFLRIETDMSDCSSNSCRMIA